MTTARATARARRRRSSIAVVAFSLVILGGLYSWLAPSGQAAGPANTEQQVQAGKALYLDGCSSCHGLQAEGTALAPSLIGVGGAAVDFQVGTGRMPLAAQGAEAPRKRALYSPTQIAQLAAFIQAIGGGPDVVHVGNAYLDADLAEGGELFRSNCASCHNAVGAGGALTYGKSAPSLSQATPEQLYEAMLTGPENMPVFSNSQLTPQEKLAIIDYVTHVRAQPDPGGLGLGRIGPVSEGLVGWLLGVLALVGVAFWMGSRA
ncbi:MAG TPA: c-type cytochrome [Mycobacteriales bacterium]|nr:c-type cytochrome [Mycobacteriales bacterium]